MITRSTVFVFAILLATAPTTHADEPRKALVHPPLQSSSDTKPAAPAEEPKKDLTDQEIKALIDQLVSPNPKPITGDEDRSVAPYYRLPPGFDREKQKLVVEAMGELKAQGLRAFPFLIDRWDDKRHCLTISVGINGYHRNQTVGKTCKMIVFDQVQPFAPWGMRGEPERRKKPYRPDYPARFLSSKTDALKWCEEHKGKSLAEVQLEVLDWVIAEEGTEAEKYPAVEHEYLQGLRKNLTDKRQSLPRGHYYPNAIEF